MWIEVSGVLLVATAYVVWRAVATSRDWGMRWAWRWSAGALTLCCLTSLALTTAWRRPDASPWVPGMPWDQAVNFGPGWRCDNLAKGTVCFRDPPASMATSKAAVSAAP